jgi:hypothetical protein
MTVPEFADTGWKSLGRNNKEAYHAFRNDGKLVMAIFFESRVHRVFDKFSGILQIKDRADFWDSREARRILEIATPPSFWRML